MGLALVTIRPERIIAAEFELRALFGRFLPRLQAAREGGLFFAWGQQPQSKFRRKAAMHFRRVK